MSREHLHVVFGAGASGRAVVRALRGRGERVRLVARRAPPDLAPGVEFAAGDAADPAQTRALCEGATQVYQCTNARDYHRWPEQFPPLQRGVMAGAAAHDATLIVLENLYVYGSQGGAPLTEDLPLRGHGLRASTRVAMTRELDEAHRRGEVRVVRVRAADLFGPHVHQSMVSDDFFGTFLGRKGLIFLLANPDLPHALSYIEDVGEAMVRAGLDPEAKGQVLHVPSTALTPRMLVRAAAEAASVPAPRIVAPPRWSLGLIMPLIGLAFPPFRGVSENEWMFYEPFVVDSSRYEARYSGEATPLPRALGETLAWYRAQAPAGSRRGGSALASPDRGVSPSAKV